MYFSTRILTRLGIRAATAALAFGCVVASAQQSAPPTAKDSGWYPESVHWSPTGTDLLVTACPKVKKSGIGCTLYRYLLEEKRWASLAQLPAPGEMIYSDAVYSPDGRHIAAIETGRNCEECRGGIGSRLVLLTADGARVRYLTPHGGRLKPTFSPDGKRLLYWSVGITTGGRTPIGLFDVWELDIGSGVERRMTEFYASELYAPPRYWPDGKRIMLVAGDYARKPNVEDYVADDPRYRITYVSRFHGNGTIVTEPGGEVVRPYFLPSEDNWLMVLDISPDGEYALYDARGTCIKAKRISEPMRHAECIGEKPNRMQVASYKPDGRWIAAIWGGPEVLWKLGILNLDDGKVEFIDLTW